MAAKKKAAKKKAKAAPAVKTAAPAVAKKTAKKGAAAKKTAKKTAKRGAAPKAGVPVSAIIHWEIQATDPAKVQRFYGDLFGWKIDANNPMNYGMVDSSGKEGINGGIGGAMGGPSRLLVYATVTDINAALARAEELGAKTMMPRTDVGPVIIGIFQDIEGNAFGLIEG